MTALLKSQSHRCCVPGCKETLQNVLARDQSITLFRFPKDSTRCNQWKDFVQRPDIDRMSPNVLYASRRVCELHFVPSDFCNAQNRQRLKTTAVPSIQTVAEYKSIYSSSTTSETNELQTDELSGVTEMDRFLVNTLTIPVYPQELCERLIQQAVKDNKNPISLSQLLGLKKDSTDEDLPLADTEINYVPVSDAAELQQSTKNVEVFSTGSGVNFLLPDDELSEVVIPENSGCTIDDLPPEGEMVEILFEEDDGTQRKAEVIVQPNTFSIHPSEDYQQQQQLRMVLPSYESSVQRNATDSKVDASTPSYEDLLARLQSTTDQLNEAHSTIHSLTKTVLTLKQQSNPNKATPS